MGNFNINNSFCFSFFFFSPHTVTKPILIGGRVRDTGLLHVPVFPFFFMLVSAKSFVVIALRDEQPFKMRQTVQTVIVPCERVHPENIKECIITNNEEIMVSMSNIIYKAKKKNSI